MSQHTLTRTVNATAANRPTSRRRSTNVVVWVLQVLAAISFVFAASGKLTGDPRAVESFNEIGPGDWFRYLIGTLELAGGIALLIPILSGLAGLAFVGLMVGATITQATVFDGEMVAAPLFMLVVVAIIAWARRDRTTQLFTLLRNGGRRPTG
jgi:uncharacterized membrane protein YphA (DoxX/SURF4 family)